MPKDLCRCLSCPLSPLLPLAKWQGLQYLTSDTSGGEGGLNGGLLGGRGQILPEITVHMAVVVMLAGLWSF